MLLSPSAMKCAHDPFAKAVLSFAVAGLGVPDCSNFSLAYRRLQRGMIALHLIRISQREFSHRRIEGIARRTEIPADHCRYLAGLHMSTRDHDALSMMGVQAF